MATAIAKKAPNVDELLLKIDGVIDQLQSIRHMAELLTVEEGNSDGCADNRAGRTD